MQSKKLTNVLQKKKKNQWLKKKKRKKNWQCENYRIFLIFILPTQRAEESPPNIIKMFLSQTSDYLLLAIKKVLKKEKEIKVKINK